MAYPVHRKKARTLPALSGSALRICLFAGISSVTMPVSAYAATATTTAHKSLHQHRKKAGSKAQHTTAAASGATMARSPATIYGAPQKQQTLQAATGTANAASSVEASSVEDVKVVGSRLIRNSIDAIQPIISVSGKQIQRRGYTNVGTALLTENPAFAVGAATPFGSGGGSGAGQTFLNLLNMGSERTLTVVNGHRFISGASASLYGNVSGDAVDVTEIPDGLIDHIDTLATGGSPTYGADAIAGVVNMQLKQNVEGLHINGQAGWSQAMDAVNDKVEFLGGHNFDHDRGNIEMDVEYSKQYGLPADARPYWYGTDSPFNLAVSGQPYQQALARNMRDILYTQTGIPVTSDTVPFGQNAAGTGIAPQGGIMNSAGQVLQFSPNGKSFVPITYDTANSPASPYNVSGGNGFPQARFANLLDQTGRVALTSLAHYDITDHITAYGEAWYDRYNSTNTIGQPYYSTASFNSAGLPAGNLILNTNNPFLTPAEQATISNGLAAAGSPTNQFLMARASTDIYSGRYTTENEMYRFVGGFKGDFSVLGRKVFWDANANYGDNSSVNFQDQVNNQNFANALNATTDGAGNIICMPGYTNSPMATRNASCAPLNLFGYNQASQSAINYITSPASTATHNTQLDVNLTAHTTLFHLPAGGVQWLVGYEHRREGFAFEPDTFNQGVIVNGACEQQYGYSTCLPPTFGHYHTHEAFTETDIPLVKPSMNIPLIYSASMNSSARFIYNSATGSYWSYTGGASLSPFQSLTFRGNYTRSLRAPGVAELYAPQSTDFEYGNDPCDTNYINGGSNPAIRAANCAQAGVPAGFQSLISNATVEGHAGGNRHLQNEVGTSVSAGFIFHPNFIPGLNIQGDYIDVRLNGAIQTPGIQYIMQACYDTAGYDSSPYCKLFTRDSVTHQITDFNDSFQNIGGLESRVAQFQFDYNLDLHRVGLPDTAGWLDLHATELHYFLSNQNIGNVVTQQYGTSATPKDNMTANLTYTRGPFSFQWQTQWYGKSQQSVQNPLSTYQFPFFNQFFMFNTNMSYEFAKKYTVFFNVNNITGEHPPFPYVGSVNRYAQAIIGRSFLFGFRADVF